MLDGGVGMDGGCLGGQRVIDWWLEGG